MERSSTTPNSLASDNEEVNVIHPIAPTHMNHPQIFKKVLILIDILMNRILRGLATGLPHKSPLPL
jgi:hypothetical protein